MIERKGRPRRYALDPASGIPNRELARSAARLIELSERVLDQIEDLPDPAMDASPDGTGLSIGRLALHLAWAEMSWIGRLTGIEVPAHLAEELAPGALETFSGPPPASGGAARFRPLFAALRESCTLPGLRAISDPFEKRESRGLRIDAAGVAEHLAWHWTYHSGHIGLLRMLAGYDYTWTFGDEVSSGPR
jgi:uncharacterized damage-inducible protein DinB